MERILVAVDFSDCSRGALRYAMELYQYFDARLRVVHVASERYGHLRTSERILPVPEGATDLERELIEMILDEFRGGSHAFPRIDKKILEGVSGVEILREAEEWGADLIVLGSHGKSVIDRLRLGSVSREVLGRASAPVLVVHESMQAMPERIVAAVDGGAGTEDVLRTAGDWARTLGSQLGVLHVLPELAEPVAVRIYPDSDLRPETRAMLRQVRQNVDAVVARVFQREAPPIEYRVGRADTEICAHVEDGAPALVIVGPHEPHGWLDWVDTAARVAQDCRCPVLVSRDLKSAPLTHGVRSVA